MWHDILHYSLIVIACWVGLCLLTALVSKGHRGTAAGASMAPILIAFVLIALIASADERRQRNKERAVPRALALIGAAGLVALIYWHSAIWAVLNSLLS